MRILQCVIIVFICCSASCFFDNTRPHPSDKELLDNFTAHEKEFNQLIGMWREDPQMDRIAEDWLGRYDSSRSWPRPEAEWGISKERWDAYKERFVKLKLKGGLLMQGPNRMVLVVNYEHGSAKGYLYTPEPPGRLENSLDDIDFSNATGNYFHRQIKENWYLYLDAW